MAENIFDELAENLQNKILTTEQKDKMAYAGAKKFAELASEEAKKHHYGKHSGQHMADAIKAKHGDIDGNRDGTATVGFDRRFSSYLAMWTNWGTVKMKGDDWLDKLRDDAKTREEVLREQERVLKNESSS